MAQIILTLLFYLLLAGIFVMVYLMWRSGVRDRERLSQALVDATRTSTEVAKEVAEALHLLAQKGH